MGHYHQEKSEVYVIEHKYTETFSALAFNLIEVHSL